MNFLHWFIVGAFNPPSIMFRKYAQTVLTSSSEKNLKNKLLFEMDICTRKDQPLSVSVFRIRIVIFLAFLNPDTYWESRSRCRSKEINQNEEA
jgi:hypothetical protein